MSSPRDDRFYAGYGKPRRNSPGADSQGGGLFTGQGGRPVLPPISSAFPISRSSGLLPLITVLIVQRTQLIHPCV
jgi:homeobox protein YOX1/YHP1